TVLAWLSKDDSHRPRLITLYFSEPDHTSHESGPNSLEVKAALLRMDSLLGTLMQGIKTLRNPVNTILVSDHGMSELTIANETYTFLDEIYDVRSTKIRTVVSSTLAHLYIDNKSTADSMYTFLKSRENHFIVYRKPD